MTATDPRLDPNSDSFDSKYWVANLRTLHDSDPTYYKPASLGVAYKGLRAYGKAAVADYQANFANGAWKTLQSVKERLFPSSETQAFDILKPMDGLALPGELTVVLGRPGAGCTTFLKTLAGHTYGFHVDKELVLSYDGWTPAEIDKHYRGEVIYCAETETHFPQLTVGTTLEFAAKMRTPSNRPPNVSRDMYAKHMTDVVLATYGLLHTKNTKVGNEYIRGVSGGERKRVSIAEVALSQASLQCWDNSTRGLDSATALEFIRALKTSATISNATPLIAIYQCSQDSYEYFDKVVLLYEGYQIFFGPAKAAKDFFLDMGYDCPDRQTTADFLTSITNPSERIVRPGFDKKVPRTPVEFYEYWQRSPQRAGLLEHIDSYLSTSNTELLKAAFKESHLAHQSKRARAGSPFTVSFLMQVKYIMGRNVMRLRGDPSIALFSVLGNIGMSFVIASVFFNMKHNTGSFYHRTAALFFGVLFNAFSSILEIFLLYEARPIVEKHKTYALYHPAADALAGVITELPNKLTIGIFFNLVLYFMVNFRRDPGHFFFYLFVNFLATLSMSHLFRTIGAACKTLSQAMMPAAILLLALSVFTGFVIPTPKMHGWCRWINYINPIAYTFESLMTNEFSGIDFPCSDFVPAGPGYPTSGTGRACSTIGSEPGSSFVSGAKYIGISFLYYNSHKWRNVGIVIGYIVFFLGTYVFLTEVNKGAMQKGEILLFQRSALRKLRKHHSLDIEVGKFEKYDIAEKESDTSSDDVNRLPANDRTFHWRALTYHVKIKSEDRTILNSVDGWVRPGQLTALMGASGAGKTTLLNALSERLTSGVITSGTRMVDGHHLDSSFQRSIGYVQQQDLHLQTSTVIEALRFSAYLRQPQRVSKKEKDEYVDYVIRLLEMEKYADAVVGVAGEGLNVEQRKRLTIGVELVAKPKLLLFLDEPTSGLDSQTAWSICKLIRKLADNGQAILCTIHQPSALLLEEFDRLLFLQKGGQTVYFGELGENFRTLIDYFEKYGAPKCPKDANPAEWMLDVIGAAPGSHAIQDYFEVWRNSSEFQDVNGELDIMETELVKKPVDTDPENKKLYAAPFLVQYGIVLKRVFEQYWRTPAFTYSKVLMTVFASIFNGFSFYKADKSLQGLQNQMFSIFMYFVLLNTLVQQYLPQFVAQRDLYEVRERPSKTFSWYAFLSAMITAEIPWAVACGTIGFFCWYYPVGFYENAVSTNAVHERGALMWITIVLFFIYVSSMAQLCISFNEVADNGANLSSLLFTLCLIFCGVLATKESLPGFWVFMYRFNPFTYLVAAILSIGLANADVTCSDLEILRFASQNGQSCAEYVGPFMKATGGYLVNPSSTGTCEYCTISSTNTFLDLVGANYSHIGRNIGIFIAFIVFNYVGTILFYWLARVPRGDRQKK